MSSSEWGDTNARLEQMQGEASQIGLASLAGYMVAAAAAPIAMRAGARAGIGALARRAGSAAASAGRKATAGAATTARNATVQGTRGGAGFLKRAETAAVSARQRATKSGGSIDVSRFADDVGWSLPLRLRRQSAKYEGFRRDPAVKKAHRSRALFGQSKDMQSLRAQHGGRQELMKSAASAVTREQMMVLPGVYAVDSYAGITGAVGEDAPAAMDFAGHATNFMSWLPTYGMYEAAGRAAFMGPGLAKAGISRAINNLDGKEALGQTLGGIYRRGEDALEAIGKASRDFRNEHTRKAGASSSPVRAGLQAAGSFLKRARVERRSKPPSTNSSNQRFIDHDITKRDEALMGASTMLEDGGDRLMEMLRSGGGDALDRVNSVLSRVITDPSGETHTSGVAGAFGFKAAGLGDVSDRLRGQAKQSAAKLKSNIDKFKTRASRPGAPEGAKDIAERLHYEDLRLSGFAKNKKGQTFRMPTAGDLGEMAGRIMDGVTRVFMPGTKQSVSLYGIGQGRAVLGRRGAVQAIEGAMPIGNEMAHVGKMPADVKQSQLLGGTKFDWGLAIADRPGSNRFSAIASRSDTSQIEDITQGRSLTMYSTPGNSKAMQLKLSDFNAAETSLSLDAEQRMGEGDGFMARMSHKLQMFGGQHNTLISRGLNAIGGGTPRNIFGRQSKLWTRTNDEMLTTAGRRDITDGMSISRTALQRSTDVYKEEKVFAAALDGLSINTGGYKADRAIPGMGGAKNRKAFHTSPTRILQSDEEAFHAAEFVISRMDTGVKGGIAPSYGKAAKIIREANATPSTYHNKGGEARSDVLRQFLFEQGALGTEGAGRDQLKRVTDTLMRQAQTGKLDTKRVLEARVGLSHLELQQRADRRISNPYSLMTGTGGGSVETDEIRHAARAVFEDNKQILQRFGKQRGQVDFAYHNKGRTLASKNEGLTDHTGYYLEEPGAMGYFKLLGTSGLDTSRQALELIGMGWDRRLSGKEVAKMWGSRGLLGGAAFTGFNVADAAAAEYLPGDGIKAAGADIVASTHLTASYMQDVFGLTGAAQYMEGLMPKSTSTLPGAALGYVKGGPVGALYGGMLNRMTAETLSGGPFEAMSILPPLAPFVTDMTRDHEETTDLYEGRKLEGVRDGRWFLLSTSDYAGGRIGSYRPNWYQRTKADAASTDVLYGSKMKKALFQDIPVVGASVGDILHPQYLQNRNYDDRPYVEPRKAFENAALVGPVLGATVGTALNAIHPLASNERMHVQDFAPSVSADQVSGGSGLGGGTAGAAGGYAAAGGSGIQGRGGVLAGGPSASNYGRASGIDIGDASGVRQDEFMGTAYIGSDTVVGANSAQGVIDEQFYRTAYSMGFIGFGLQETVGGKGIYRSGIMPSAGQMDNPQRFYHDAQTGDLFGAGEPLRRFYPSDRNMDELGPPNTMPDWMPRELRCLAPDTLVEVNGTSFEKAKDITPGTIIRTHTGQLAPVTIVQHREMDPDEKLFEVEIHNNMHFTHTVSEEHPFWTPNGWQEIQDIDEEDYVGYPVPSMDSLYSPTVIDVTDYVSGFDFDDEWIYSSGYTGYKMPRHLNIDNEAFGVIQGYFVAEGCTSGRRQMNIALDQSEIEYSSELRNAFETVFDYDLRKRTCAADTVIRWTADSTLLTRFFRNFFGSSSYNKQLWLTESNWKATMRTLFNGDGCFFETAAGKYQCALTQPNNDLLRYQVWQVALANGIAGADSGKSLVFRCDQAAAWAELIELDKAKGYGILEDKSHVVDLSNHVDQSRFTVTEEWIYSNSSIYIPLIEYIENEKDGDPYWKRGEAKKACQKLDIPYNKYRGPKARRSYRSLQQKGGALYRIPKFVDLNKSLELFRNPTQNSLLREVVKSLRKVQLLGPKLPSRPHRNGYWYFENGYFYVKIANKREVSQQKLISLCVVGDHSFCLPGVATHNSGDPYCLSPDTLVESDGALYRADDLHEIAQHETVHVRTHTGERKPVVATQARDVDEKIIRFTVEGLPWPIKVTKEHPVLVRIAPKKTKTEWKLAGDLTENDVVIAPSLKNPPPLPVDTEDNYPDRLVRALPAMAKLRTKGRFRAKIEELTLEERRFLREAFDLEDRPTPVYTSRVLTRGIDALRAEGLPLEIMHCSADALQFLMRTWGEQKDGQFVFELVPMHIRRAFGETGEDLPETSFVLQRSAYRLAVALAAAGMSADVTRISDERYRFTFRGVSAVKVLVSPYLVYKHSYKKGHKLAGIDFDTGGPGVFTSRKDEHSTAYPISSISEEHYTGKVYAFEVEDDASFVVSGIATHNSQVEAGELLLPGAGIEQLGQVGSSELVLDPMHIGGDSYDTALRQLGIVSNGMTNQASWAKQMATQRLIEAGIAIREEAVFVDDTQRVAAVAAATKGNEPVHVQAMSASEFRATHSPRELDTERLNAMMGAANTAQGMLSYVNQETGEIQTYVQQFDSGMYQSSIAKMQQGLALAKEYANEGYGRPGALYGPVDRLQVLLNADPFGDEWRVENRKAQQLYAQGLMTMEERARYDEIQGYHKKMGLSQEIYMPRFNNSQLFNPEQDYLNLTYNENVDAAANYSMPERLAGSVWESFSNLRTPAHTKFFGAYDLETSYQNNVLLNRDFQNWGRPVDDFVKPYMRGMIAADDPVQGGLSAGVAGLSFAGPAYGTVSAVAGALYGSAHGAYRQLTGTQYVPGAVEEERQVAQSMDRIGYYRAKQLYDATGSEQFLDQMSQTSYGWTQDGLSGEGWAKERRGTFSPATRLESNLYAQDQGFRSPWAGLKASRAFTSKLLKNSGSPLTIGNQKTRNTLASLDRTTGSPAGGPGGPSTVALAEGRVPARLHTIGGRSEANVASAPARKYLDPQGLPDTGMASTYRNVQTAVRGNLGFASPFQGQDPMQDVMWGAYDPMRRDLPPEVYSMFPAAHRKDRSFLTAAMFERDPERQERLRQMMHEDTTAMLDVARAHVYGDTDQSVGMDPMAELNAPLSSHPVMGLGADVDAYHVKTLEDGGINPNKAGLGWKSQMTRMNGMLLQPSSVANVMRGNATTQSADPEHIKVMVQGALLQLGIRTEVNVQKTGGLPEIHFYQQ